MITSLRRPIRFCLLLLAIPCLLALMPASSHGADELDPAAREALLKQLRDVHVKQPDFDATFTEQRTSHLLNKPVISEGSIDFSAPDKFRREVKTPSPSTTVSDGRTMWIFYPSFNEVEEYQLGQKSFFDESLEALTAGLNFEHIDEFYNFRAFKEAAGYRIELTPKKPALRRVVQTLTLHLSGEFLPQKTEIVLPKGDQLDTVYHNARRSPLPASTFEFTPPAGATITHPLGK